MNSPLHLVSQVINAYWLTLMTCCIFLLLRDTYFPRLEGYWLLLVMGLLFAFMALVSSGYERLVDRASGVVNGEFEFIVGRRTWKSLFKAYLVGVVLGAATLWFVGFIVGGMLNLRNV